jgi:hypothetical protein
MPRYRIIAETGAWIDGKRREQGFEFTATADATEVDVLRHFKAIEEVVEQPAEPAQTPQNLQPAEPPPSSPSAAPTEAPAEEPPPAPQAEPPSAPAPAKRRAKARS